MLRLRGYAAQKLAASVMFSACAGDVDILRQLYLQGVDLGMSDSNKRTALHLAASEGHVEAVEFLVNVARVIIDPRDRWNRTPSDDALSFGYPQIAVLLGQALTRSDSINTVRDPSTKHESTLPEDFSALSSGEDSDEGLGTGDSSPPYSRSRA